MSSEQIFQRTGRLIALELAGDGYVMEQVRAPFWAGKCAAAYGCDVTVELGVPKITMWVPFKLLAAGQ